MWDGEIVPALTDYIRIPNVSPAYDAGWAEAGHMARAVELARAWCAAPADRRARPSRSSRLEGRTPLLLCDVPATGDTDAGDRPPATPSCSTATSTSSRR